MQTLKQKTLTPELKFLKLLNTVLGLPMNDSTSCAQYLASQIIHTPLKTMCIYSTSIMIGKLLRCPIVDSFSLF